MIDLSPDRESPDLIDALYEVRSENRRDLSDAVVALLEHDDPIIREEAVSLLLTKWEIHELRDRAKQILLSDEDAGVRARTAVGLASITTPRRRADDAALLAKVYAEPSASRALQLACMEALYLMVGRPTLAEQDDLGPKAVQRLLAEIAGMGE
jgi:hypothetical protein